MEAIRDSSIFTNMPSELSELIKAGVYTLYMSPDQNKYLISSRDGLCFVANFSFKSIEKILAIPKDIDSWSRVFPEFDFKFEKITSNSGF